MHFIWLWAVAVRSVPQITFKYDDNKVSCTCDQNMLRHFDSPFNMHASDSSLNLFFVVVFLRQMRRFSGSWATKQRFAVLDADDEIPCFDNLHVDCCELRCSTNPTSVLLRELLYPGIQLMIYPETPIRLRRLYAYHEKERQSSNVNRLLVLEGLCMARSCTCPWSLFVLHSRHHTSSAVSIALVRQFNLSKMETRKTVRCSFISMQLLFSPWPRDARNHYLPKVNCLRVRHLHVKRQLSVWQKWCAYFLHFRIVGIHAYSAIELVRIVETQKSDIHLIICGQCSPRDSGKMVLKCLATVRDAVPVCFVTGKTKQEVNSSLDMVRRYVFMWEVTQHVTRQIGMQHSDKSMH